MRDAPEDFKITEFSQEGMTFHACSFNEGFRLVAVIHMSRPEFCSQPTAGVLPPSATDCFTVLPAVDLSNPVTVWTPQQWFGWRAAVSISDLLQSINVRPRQSLAHNEIRPGLERNSC